MLCRLGRYSEAVIAARVDRLEGLLNPWGLLSFPANAKKGEGVREALKAILGLTVNHLETQPEDNYNGRETFVEPEDSSVAVADKESGLGIDYHLFATDRRFDLALLDFLQHRMWRRKQVRRRAQGGGR